MAAGSKSAQKKEEEEEAGPGENGYSLPAVRLLPRTPGEGGSSPSLAVTPDVATSSSAAGKKTAQQKPKILAPLNATGTFANSTLTISLYTCIYVHYHRHKINGNPMILPLI